MLGTLDLSRWLALCATALVLSGSLVGCGAARAEPRYVRASVTIGEFRDEAKRLELAPGWNWPATLDYEEVADDGDRMMYEVNIGRIDAAWYWHCSWARTYFSSTEPADRDTALAKVLELRDSAFYRWGLDERERRGTDQLLDDASVGNTEELKRTVDLNCPVTSK